MRDMTVLELQALRNQPELELLELLDYLMNSRDTGISSETMIMVHLGIPLHRVYDPVNNYPSDPSDFGRCYRLVQHFPSIKNSFGLLAVLNDQWKNVIENWDKMCQVYERDLPTGHSSELYSMLH